MDIKTQAVNGKNIRRGQFSTKDWGGGSAFGRHFSKGIVLVYFCRCQDHTLLKKGVGGGGSKNGAQLPLLHGIVFR